MIPAILYKDFYKTDHRQQYPDGTEKVYSNLTARISRVQGIDAVIGVWRSIFHTRLFG